MPARSKGASASAARKKASASASGARSARTAARGKGVRYGFDTDAARRILERVSNGMGITRALGEVGIKWERFTRWLRDEPEFARAYAAARDAYLDRMAEEVIEIADSAMHAATPAEIHAARLRFDARRWYLSKLAPKRYGDRVALEHSGPGGGPIEHAHAMSQEQIDAVARALKARIRD